MRAMWNATKCWGGGSRKETGTATSADDRFYQAAAIINVNSLICGETEQLQAREQRVPGARSGVRAERTDLQVE